MICRAKYFLTYGILGSGLLILPACSKDTDQLATLGEQKPNINTIVREDVATTITERISLPQTVWVTGSLAADELSNVASKRNGIVASVAIDRGTIVKQGDVLVQLDTVDAVNALEQSEAQAAELMVRLGLTSADQTFDPANQPDVRAAKATLDLAKANYDRDKSLIESRVISPGEFDETRNTYNTALQRYELSLAEASQLYRQFQTTLANVKIARQTLDDMTIRAPFDGAIVEKNVAPGEAISNASSVAVMVRINPLRLLLQVPEQNVGRIETGQKVYATVDAFPDMVFPGVVKRISPALDPETRTLIVEAELPNNDRLLKPGLFVTAQVEVDGERTGVRVPATAVRWNNETAQVYIVEEGIARATMVVADKPKDGFIEIVEGLQGGETIVSNASEVEDGIRIQ